MGLFCAVRTRGYARHGVRARSSRVGDASRVIRNQALRCGARTRGGTPCQAPPVWDDARNQPVNGRCRLHGGLSTGPKTQKGRRRSLEALRRGRAAWLERSAGEASSYNSAQADHRVSDDAD